jgi:hypothetical protein
MRVTFLAALAAMLLGCQQPNAPEAEQKLDPAVPPPATVHSPFIVEEAEEHQGC